MQEKIRKCINKALEVLDIEQVDFVVEHPQDPTHGDYSSNVAMVLASKTGENPRDVAEEIISEMQCDKHVGDIEIAGPGFINLTLTRHFFETELALALSEGENYGKNDKFAGEKIIVEYTDPNILKPFHIGHLMSNAIGESISRLVEVGGAKVRRVTYQGDVGLHIAKAIWGMKQLGDEMPADGDTLSEKSDFLGKAYVHGATNYEESPDIKEEIDELNVRIYKGGDEEINNLYNTGKNWSMDHLEEIYEILGSEFEENYMESNAAEKGKKLVYDNIGKVFEESEGAVVYPEEKSGLHTRVFITSKGLPTYEAKELALPRLKFEDFEYDTSVVVTADEQREYFKVVLSALSEIDPELAKKTKHVTHGMMQLPTGKMSSRKGDVVSGESLLNQTIEAVSGILEEREGLENKEEIAREVAVGALKYVILKQNTGKNITYDEKQALSFEGDSGPYLQYTYARARSVLRKAKEEGVKGSPQMESETVYPPERLLVQFPEALERAQRELEPHHITTYLTELASAFNSFYGKEQIVDKKDPNSPYKIALTEAVAQIIKNGLWILGIESPEKM